MPDSVLGKIAVEIGGGTAANGGGGGSPSSSSISGGGDADTKKNLGLLGNMRDSLGKMTKNSSGEPRFWTKALKTMGIQVGLAGILKQSQVFTSTLGSLFQILGAFVDVILAPWLPLIMPLMRNLANKIPWVKKKSEQAFKWVTETFAPWLMKVGGTVKKVITTAWDGIKGFLDVVFNSEKWGPTITKGMEAVSKWWKGLEWTSMLKSLWEGALNMLKGFWDSTLGGLKIFGTTIPSFGTKEGAKDDKAGQRGSEDEQRGPTTLGGGPGRGGNGDKNPWIPTLDDPLAPFKEAGEKLDDALENFANMDFAKQVGAGYTAAMAARYAVTPIAGVAKLVLPGVAGPIVDVLKDAVKKPHQIMNFLAKNTGKAMAATFGHVAGQVTNKGAGAAASAVDTQRLLDMGLEEEDMRGIGKKSRITQAKRILQGFGSGAQRHLGADVGQEVGGAVSQKAGRAVSTVAQKVGVGLSAAGKEARSMLDWLKGVMSGNIKKVTPDIANAKIDKLWKAFAPVIGQNAAMKAAPLLLTRIARYLVPGAALAFVFGETKYDIGKMLESDVPWLRDINKETLAAEAKLLAGGGAMALGGEGLSANAISGLIPMALGKFGIGDAGKGAEQRMQTSMGIFEGGQELMMENYGKGAFTGTKGQIIGTRLLAALMEGGGSMLGPAGLPVSLGGMMVAEGTRQQAGIGFGSGQDYFSSGQFKNDLSFMTGGMIKVSVDGQSGEAYLASE